MGEKIKELTFFDDILAPKDTIVINYKGKDPYRPVLMIHKLLVSIMKVETKNVYERDSRWSMLTGDFYSVWIGLREDDRLTKTYIRVIIQGLQDKERMGWIKIELKGFVRTSYNFSNFIQRAFWWFYNRMFYYRQRRNYIELAKDNLHLARDELMKALGIRLTRREA